MMIHDTECSPCSIRNSLQAKKTFVAEGQKALQGLLRWTLASLDSPFVISLTSTLDIPQGIPECPSEENPDFAFCSIPVVPLPSLTKI